MFDPLVMTSLLGGGVLCAPFVLLGFLSVMSLFERPAGERTIGLMLGLCTLAGLLAAAAMLVLMLVHGNLHHTLELLDWVTVTDFHFSIKFVFDTLSVPFVILTHLLCGTVGAFALRYMHREPGFNRFFVLYALFVLGMTMTALAGTIETLFTASAHRGRRR